MKNKTMKRALSLFLAAVMIALALPLTMLPTMAAEEETIPTTIKNAKMFAKYPDTWALNPVYGSVEGMIDGDPYRTKTNNNAEYPYYCSALHVTVAKNTELYINSIDETRTYWGYALFELNGLSKLSDVTVWLAGDGVSGATNHWTKQLGWNMVDGYDILVSTDGETWTLMSEVTGLHTTFPSANATRATKKATGGNYNIYGNCVALDSVEAKYVAIAVTNPANFDGKDAIVIGEVTVNGTTTASAVAQKTPAQKYAEAKDGTLLHTVNFNDPSWSDNYNNANHWFSYYIVTENGSTVEHGLTTANFYDGYTNTKFSSMWGGIVSDERFPLNGDYKYTVYYDMKFYANDSKSACGLQLDTYHTNTLFVDGAGNSYWYQWTSEKIGAPTDDSEKWTSKIGEKSKSATQNFAIEIDLANKTLTLYVADHNGTYQKVRTLEYDGAYTENSNSLVCRINLRNMNGNKGTDTSGATISNLQIYKGLVAERAATTVKNVKMFAKYDDGWALHPLYGSVKGMIDGDAYDTSRDEKNASRYPYFYSAGGFKYDGNSQIIGLNAGAYLNTDMYISSIDETRTYYGYALLELDAMSALSDVTVWLAADGNSAGNAAAWSNPKANWNMNNAYDILVSEDGVNWTLMGEYDDMCGDGTNKGAGFPGRFDDDYAMKTVDGYLRLGHKAYLGGIEAKYVAVAVKECINETGNQIVIGELTVTGLVSSESTEKTPAEIYAEAEDGDLLKAINFNEAYWSDDYFNNSHWNTYYIVTDNGNAVKQSIHTKYLFGANNKRAMWGGLIADEQFPIVNDSDDADSDNCYTVYFDLKFGNDNENVGFGIQVDGTNSLVVDGKGNSYWYNWNTQRVGAPTDPNEMWTNKTSIPATEKQTFAIEIDSNNESMTLYVADSDGLFNKVRTLTYEAGVDVDSGTPYDAAWIDYNLTCGIYIINISGTVLDRSTEISNLRIYKGLSAGYIRNSVGASVRLAEPTGIRFKSQFRKELIDSLKETYEADKVKIGMLITPTDYITRNGVDFTMAALDACDAITGDKYVKIDATAIHENENYYVIHCALVRIKEGNYDRQFSARAFIEVNGEVYKYAEFDMEDNSRSIAEVAEKAYNDVKATQDSVYKNAITIGTGHIAVSYSPYTAEERAILDPFFDVEDPTSSISVMTYNIKGTDDDREEKRDITKAYSFIANSGVDVIGLQEDDSSNYNSIKNLNSNYKVLNSGGNGSEDNAILYDSTKYELANSGGTVYFKKLVDTNDVYKTVKDITGTGKAYVSKVEDGKTNYYAEGEEITVTVDFSRDEEGDDEGGYYGYGGTPKGRFFRWAVLRDKETGVEYLVVNTHIHYRNGSHDKTPSSTQNKLLRQAQLTLIKLWLENDATAKQYANSIVMGDLNTQHDSNAIGGLTKGGTMAQARDTAVMIGDDWGTLVEADANEKEYMERKKWIYDHVVYNSDALVAAKFTVIDNKLTGTDAAKANYPSDHLPVAAEFYYYK